MRILEAERSILRNADCCCGLCECLASCWELNKRASRRQAVLYLLFSLVDGIICTVPELSVSFISTVFLVDFGIVIVSAMFEQCVCQFEQCVCQFEQCVCW